MDVLYHCDLPEYKKLILQIAPYYKALNNNQNPISQATRYVRNKFVIIMNQNENNNAINFNTEQSFVFGYTKTTLLGVQCDNKEPCWNCNLRIGKYEGKCCNNINCRHPKMNNHKRTKIIQFHTECLYWLNYNLHHVCQYCVMDLNQFSYIQFYSTFTNSR